VATPDAPVPRHGRALALALAVLLPLAAALSLSTGSSDIGPWEAAWAVLYRAGLVGPYDGAVAPEVWESRVVIVCELRLPRVLLGIVTGAALSLSGVAFQALLRDPLADPFIIGVSSGASLAAALALAAGASAWVPPAGFLGGLAAVWLVYRLALEGGEVSVRTMLLAGVVVSSFLSACTTLLITLLGRDMASVVFWLMGSLSRASLWLVAPVALSTLLGGLVLMALSRDLNLLLLGEDHARHLGCDVGRVKAACFLVASLLAGTVVSLTGLIGFVGLVVPHIVRLVAGPDNRTLVPCSAALGAAFLLAADVAARTVIAPQEVPVGALTAFVGGPFFLFLLVRSRRGG
jgi:iron complex transport system permease protein